VPGCDDRSSAAAVVDRAAANCVALWDGLERSVFVETHHPMWAGGVFQRGIGFLDERVFPPAWGSVLVQNERSACQLSPASTKKRRTVVGSMCSRPGSRRSRRVSNSNDQVAVPSRRGSGGVRPISKTRWRSAGPYHTGAPDLGMINQPSQPVRLEAAAPQRGRILAAANPASGSCQ
jgi:hypothetical protein